MNRQIVNLFALSLAAVTKQKYENLLELEMNMDGHKVILKSICRFCSTELKKGAKVSVETLRDKPKNSYIK